MATSARLPIVASRVGACVRTILFQGLDLTGCTLELQARLAPDTPGAPLLDLTVQNVGVEGLSIGVVTVTNGVPTTPVIVRIAEATMKDPTKVPYMGELGDPGILAYDMIGSGGALGADKRLLVYGDLIALASVNGADNAPANRAPSFGRIEAWGGTNTATITLDNGTAAQISIDGVDVLGGYLTDAHAARDEALAAAAKVQAFAGILAPTAPPGWKAPFVDDGGSVFGGLLDDDAGSFQFPVLLADTLNGVPVDQIIAASTGNASKVARVMGTYASEIAMWTSYGQSQSLTAVPATLDGVPQTYDALKFSGGTRSELDNPSNPYDSLVALTENLNATQPNGTMMGETPLTGFCNGLKDRILAVDGLTGADLSYQLLVNACGADGQPLATMISGTAAFARHQRGIQNGMRLVAAEGKSFTAAGYFWAGGEADGGAGTPRALYRDTFSQMQIDLQTMVQGITGQTQPYVCITYQTMPVLPISWSEIALAQLAATKINPNIYMSGPIYHIPRGPDGVHMIAQYERVYGYQQAITAYDVVNQGIAWVPMSFRSAYRQGNIIILRLHVPYGEIVFDSAMVAAKANYGLSLTATDGSNEAINSVTKIGPDTLKIVAASPVSAGTLIRSAYGIGGTNIRDQRGDSIVYTEGAFTFPMHDWLVADELALA